MTDIDKKCRDLNIKTPNNLAIFTINRWKLLNPTYSQDGRIELFSILSVLNENERVLYLESLIKVNQKTWSVEPGQIELIKLIKIAEEELFELKKRIFKAPQIPKRSKKPIYWKKSVETLRHFLDSLKSNGLIENRDTDDIIQEHFFVDGGINTKESQPIKWMSTLSLLAYMIESLDRKYIQPDNLWHDIMPHFSKSGQTPQNMRQTANRYKNNKSGKPKAYQIIDDLLLKS